MHVTSEQYIAEDILEREFTLGEVPGILWTPKSASPAARIWPTTLANAVRPGEPTMSPTTSILILSCLCLGELGVLE